MSDNTKRKNQHSSLLREAKPKKFNLAVPPALRMPHDDLIKPLAKVPDTFPGDQSDTNSQTLPDTETLQRPDTFPSNTTGTKNNTQPDTFPTQPPDTYSNEQSDTENDDIMSVRHLFQSDTNAPNLQARESAFTPSVSENPSAKVSGKKKPGHQKQFRSDTKSKTEHAPDKVRNNTWINIGIDKEFRHFLVEVGWTMTEFIERAGVHFINCVGVRGAKALDTNAPHEDLKIYRTREEIIFMYQKFTGRKWNYRDDLVGATFNTMDIRVVECGMLDCLSKSRQVQINSFKYFANEIRQAAEDLKAAGTSDASLTDYLKFKRISFERWLEKGKPR